MTSQNERHVPQLHLDHPRTTMILLDMNEALASSCEVLGVQIHDIASDTPLTKKLKRYRMIYRQRVGIEVEERQELRRRASEVISSQIGVDEPI